MSESLFIADQAASRKEKYEILIPQLKALVEGESDSIANIANCVAALQQTLNMLWIGIYFVKGDELVLGPFQGPVACTRIARGKGVCGTAWMERRSIVVEDVDKFPGHIACSSLSKSEIVLPGFKNNDVAFVLDIDSEKLNDFDEIDQTYLQQVVSVIEKTI